MSGGKGGGSKTVETSSDIPERYRDFVDQNLAMAGTIANRAYIPYGGQRIAGFSPDTLSSFGLTRSLGTPLERDLSNAHAAYTAGMNSAADPSIMMQRYQNPYTEQVIDATQADMNQSFDRASEQSRLASPFGGARLGVREGVIEGERARALGTIGGQLRSDGFRTAATLGQGATDRLMAAGDRALGLGTTGLGARLQNAGALAGIGQQQRALNQAGMDLRYGDFLDELNYPLQALSIRQSALGQTPMGSVGRTPVMSQGGMGSTLGGIGSLLAGGAQLYGAMGCWVAREVYGEHNPKWLKVRDWMFNKAPRALFEKYMQDGPRIAEKIRNDPRRKAEYRAVMDEILEAA